MREQKMFCQIVKAIENLHSVQTSLTNRQEAAAPFAVQSSVCQILFQELVAQLDQQLEVLAAEMLRLAQTADREAFELLECVEKQ